MDTLTHALIGGLIGRAIPVQAIRVPAVPVRRNSDQPEPLPVRQRILAGMLAGAFPDIDYLTFWVDPLSFLSDWHRGPTHSLLLLPVWALLLGVVLSQLFDRAGAWRAFGLIAAAALASHILTDLITVYGTAILYPMSDWRPGIGMTFFIDPWLTALAACSLLLAWRRARTPTTARLLLMPIVVYLGAQFAWQQQALDIGRGAATADDARDVATRVIAQPFSPFHWKLIRSSADGHEVAHLVLYDGPGPSVLMAGVLGLGELLRAYAPENQLVWQDYPRFGDDPATTELAREVWQHESMTRFRRFAGHPALYRIDRDTDRTCVWFTDLRFTFPSLAPAFRFGLCRDDETSPWRLHRIRRFTDDVIEAL